MIEKDFVMRRKLAIDFAYCRILVHENSSASGPRS
jgi:hypothetical protein